MVENWHILLLSSIYDFFIGLICKDVGNETYDLFPSFLRLSSNLVYARDLCAPTRRWYVSAYFKWTPDIGHILNETIDPKSIIPSISSIIKTPTLFAPRYLSSIQSIGFTLRQISFAIFYPCASTSITRMFTFCSFWSSLHCTSIFLTPTSISSFVNTALEEIIHVLNTHVNICSNHQTILQDTVRLGNMK